MATAWAFQLQHQSFQWIFSSDFFQDGLVWSHRDFEFNLQAVGTLTSLHVQTCLWFRPRPLRQLWASGSCPGSRALRSSLAPRALAVTSHCQSRQSPRQNSGSTWNFLQRVWYCYVSSSFLSFQDISATIYLFTPLCYWMFNSAHVLTLPLLKCHHPINSTNAWIWTSIGFDHWYIPSH